MDEQITPYNNILLITPIIKKRMRLAIPNITDSFNLGSKGLYFVLREKSNKTKIPNKIEDSKILSPGGKLPRKMPDGDFCHV